MRFYVLPAVVASVIIAEAEKHGVTVLCSVRSSTFIQCEDLCNVLLKLC